MLVTSCTALRAPSRESSPPLSGLVMIQPFVASRAGAPAVCVAPRLWTTVLPTSQDSVNEDEVVVAVPLVADGSALDVIEGSTLFVVDGSTDGVADGSVDGVAVGSTDEDIIRSWRNINQDRGSISRG